METLERRENSKNQSAIVERRLAELQQHPYLSELTPEECQKLNDIVHVVPVHNGEVLFEEGEKDDTVYIIRKGLMKLGHRKSEHHKWVDWGAFGVCDMDDLDETMAMEWEKVQTIKSGECVGEPCFIENGAHTLTAQAHGDGELLCVDASHLLELAKGDPEIGTHLFKALFKVHQRCM